MLRLSEIRTLTTTMMMVWGQGQGRQRGRSYRVLGMSQRPRGRPGRGYQAQTRNFRTWKATRLGQQRHLPQPQQLLLPHPAPSSKLVCVQLRGSLGSGMLPRPLRRRQAATRDLFCPRRSPFWRQREPCSRWSLHPCRSLARTWRECTFHGQPCWTKAVGRHRAASAPPTQHWP